jgi:hypothetical protein
MAVVKGKQYMMYQEKKLLLDIIGLSEIQGSVSHNKESSFLVL